MHGELGEVRHALRSLGKRPGFALAAVLTLALGVGATTVIYSAVNRVILHPLPFKGEERLVFPWHRITGMGFLKSPSPETMDAWEHGAHSLDASVRYARKQRIMERDDAPEEVSEIESGPTLLSFLGLTPALGRMFTAGEAKAGGSNVVLLSDAFWRSAFSARSDILGHTIKLDSALYTIIGVMPRRLALFDDVDVWAPLRRPPDGLTSPLMVARLRRGVTRVQAQRELQAIAERVPQTGPPAAATTVELRTPQEMKGGAVQHALPVLLGAVALVLLIACVNVALLQLVRGAARAKELGIKLAPGAGRIRLARQLLLETVVLAVLGGALGVALAWWSTRTISHLRPESLADLAHVGMDGHVLVFALIVVTLVALVIGVVPALRATDLSLSAILSAGSPGGGRTATSGRMRALLVMGEMALSVVLLVGAALLIRSLMAREHADLGFRAEGLVTLRPMLSNTRYPTMASQQAFMADLLTRARSLPGASGAMIASAAPPDYDMTFLRGLEIAGQAPLGASAPLTAASARVPPDYFRLLRIQVLNGRTFSDAENMARAPVILLSRGLADQLFPGRSAVGERVRLAGPPGAGGAQWSTVIGVVNDVAARGITGQWRRLQWYTPYGDGGFGEHEGIKMELMMSGRYLPPPGLLIVRTTGDARAMESMLRELVHTIDPEMTEVRIATVTSGFQEELAEPRFNTILLGVFALMALALALAAVGLFGVLSYAVAQRTREIGVCVALGAQPGDVRLLVLRQGMIPALAGVVLGAVAAWFATRVMASLLFGVSTRDVPAFLGAAAVLVATALAACYVPAARATRVDPVRALGAGG